MMCEVNIGIKSHSLVRRDWFVYLFCSPESKVGVYMSTKLKMSKMLRRDLIVKVEMS